MGMVLREIMDPVVPHVARIPLSATVGPDILSQHRGLGKPRFGCGGKEGLNPPSGGFTWGREDGNI